MYNGVNVRNEGICDIDVNSSQILSKSQLFLLLKAKRKVLFDSLSYKKRGMDICWQGIRNVSL